MVAANKNTDKLNDLRAMAVSDPLRARIVATRLAKTPTLAGAAGADFFEVACRVLVADGQAEVAEHCFTLARKADGGSSGVARLHPLFLEFAPADVIAPTAYRDYAKQLASELPADEAHEKFREVLGAAIDGGIIPYANLFVDLRTLAKAAGGTRVASDDFLAGYLLRAGLLAGASNRIWRAAASALARVARRDRDVLDLLLNAEPEPAMEHADRNREIWWQALKGASAGKVLPPQFFYERARGIRFDLLIDLANQSGATLFPASDTGDDALFGPTRKAPELGDNERFFSNVATDWEALAASLSRADPQRWAAFLCETAEYIKVGYSPFPKMAELWTAPPPVPQLLKELLERWTAQAAGAGLADAREALTHLEKLATYGFDELHPGFADTLRLTDPADALVTALRTGLPAELATPGLREHLGAHSCSLIQNGDRLTCTGYRDITVFSPAGLVAEWTTDYSRPADRLMAWHDGSDLLMSERHPDGWRTYLCQVGGFDGRVAGAVDERRRTAGPRAATSVKVRFPGAARSTTVDCRDGKLRFHAPDGTIASSYAFEYHQGLRFSAHALVPPGWFPYQHPVDPAGSGALRRIDRARALQLIEAGLQGPATVVERLPELIPEVSDRMLSQSIGEIAHAAACCLLSQARISAALGTPRPCDVPAVMEPRPDLPVVHAVDTLVAWRIMASAISDAADCPAAQEPYRVGITEVPAECEHVKVWFGQLGAAALIRAWDDGHPMSRHYLDSLNARVSTPWADGSGQWRLVSVRADGTGTGGDRPFGELWRTPTGAAGFITREFASDLLTIIEYASDGCFAALELPGWQQVGVQPQGWGSPNRVIAFAKLLADSGQIPIRPELAWELAARTGMSPQDASCVLFGRSKYVEGPADRSVYPPEVVASYEAAAAKFGANWVSSELAYGSAELLRARLMPDDPADLWTHGPDLDGAAAWWASSGFAGKGKWD